VSDTRTTATPERGRSSSEGGRGNWFSRVALFFRQVVAELRKVVWPTRSQLITYTSVVLVFVIAMMAIVGVFDLVMSVLVLKVFGGS
jgi:preprotein translocase subunit SecE